MDWQAVLIGLPINLLALVLFYDHIKSLKYEELQKNKMRQIRLNNLKRDVLVINLCEKEMEVLKILKNITREESTEKYIRKIIKKELSEFR